MIFQVEAERKKRAAILESEGIKVMVLSNGENPTIRSSICPNRFQRKIIDLGT